MITITIQPLTTEGRVLLPVGAPIVIATDYLHTGRAVAEVCTKRGWCLHKRSAALARCVAGKAPAAVAYTSGGMLLGMWRGALA